MSSNPHMERPVDQPTQRCVDFAARQQTRLGIGQRLHGVFSAHPASVGESYFQHQRAAMGFAAYLMVTALAAVVHAIVPSLCASTARERIAKLHNRLQVRSGHQPN